MNLEERGLDTLFLGLGMATWQPDDDGRPTDAPILLMPLCSDIDGTRVARMDAQAKR